MLSADLSDAMLLFASELIDVLMEESDMSDTDDLVVLEASEEELVDIS